MKNPERQKGLVLVILIIIVVLAFMSYVVSELSMPEVKFQQEEKTMAALKKAKQALINYAVTYADIDADADGFPDFPGEYGFLPCPDYNDGALDEGLEDTGNCGTRNVSKLGYLPWRTLSTGPIYDSSGSCLLYAVTGMYKNDPVLIRKAEMLNEDSNGTFQLVNEMGAIIEGVNPEDRIVAIVFAPGVALSAQSRTIDVDSRCGKDYGSNPLYELPDYLEGDGVIDNGVLSGAPDSIDQFINATLDSNDAAIPYNDRLITITRQEIWSAIIRRSDFLDKMTNLTEALALCLAAYNPLNNRLPWPAPIGFVGDYRSDANYSDVAGSYAGRVPFEVDDSMAGANLFASVGCNNLTLSIGPVNNVNLINPNDEYRKLWTNWKDRFYYALSNHFQPSAVPAPNCPNTCIQLDDGTAPPPQYAGIVFFSGSRLVGSTRNAPPPVGDADDKQNVSNYIENGNDVVFTAPPAGNSGDTYSINALPNNDIMFCISDTVPFVVSPC